MFFYFQGMQLIPISITMVILNMKGIVILLFSILFLRDIVTTSSVLCIVLCFLGAVLIVQPSVLLPESWVNWHSHFGVDTANQPEQAVYARSFYVLGCCFIMVTCLLKSVINIWIRKFGESCSDVR